MGERAMNYLALKSSATTKIPTTLLLGLADQCSVNLSHAVGRVFVFETNIAPMHARKGPGATFDLEFELAIQKFLCSLNESEYRMVRVNETATVADHRGEWFDHPFVQLDEEVRALEYTFMCIGEDEGQNAHAVVSLDVIADDQINPTHRVNLA